MELGFGCLSFSVEFRLYVSVLRSEELWSGLFLGVGFLWVCKT